MNDLAPDLTRSLDAENPWPGLMPFTEATRAFFHGRDTEAAELLRRVRRERLTILFGQSGLGKTSLLCAGLFPRLRAADFLPVYIRLDWTAAQISPVPQIKQALTENLTEYSVEGRPPRSDETLWGYFHDKATEFWSRRNRLITPVLVFDQFEEIFTVGYGAATAEAVLDELAALIENHPPAIVRAALDDNPEAARGYDFAKESCKVILALREDFLPDLEGLRRRMPSIIENRMRLTRMDGRQARDAILASGSHLMAPDVPEKVIAFVAASRGRSEGETVGETELAGIEIEPALLSIVCSELNNKRIRLGQAQITADLLDGAQQEIVGQFYESSLAGIDPALRLFIEEQLLTAEGYRDSRPMAEALCEPGVTRADIDKLVARRLLRIEERFGTQWVELTHDLLTEMIRQRRDLRRDQTAAALEAEQRAQAERERAERAEAEAARERAEREAQTALAREASEREQAARRLVRNTRIALAATAIMLAVVVVAVIFAAHQRHLAEERAEEFAEINLIQFRAMARTADPAALIREQVRELREYGAHIAQLAIADPGDVGRQHELALLHLNTGAYLSMSGEQAAVKEECDAAVAILNQLAAKDPANERWQHDLASVHSVIGALRTGDDLSGALKEFQQSLALMERLAAKNPTNAERQHELAVIHSRIGSVVKKQHDNGGALIEYRSYQEIMAKLPANIRDNIGWQREGAYIHNMVGSLLKDQGELSEALKEFKAELAIREPVAANDPEDSEAQK